MAISVSAQPEQKNVCVNAANSTVFFQDQALAYNYKTQQWSYLSSFSGHRFFDTASKDKVLGIARYNGTAIVMFDQESDGLLNGNPRFTTGDFQLNPDGRAIVDSVRVIGEGFSLATANYPIIRHKDVLSDARANAIATPANSRTGLHNYRNQSTGTSSPPEGRYHSMDVILNPTLTSITGAEISFIPAGKL